MTTEFFDYILEHLDKHWDFKELSMNPNITYEMVLDHPELDWDWGYLGGNPNITWDMIMDFNIYKTWNYHLISSNPNIFEKVGYELK